MKTKKTTYTVYVGGKIDKTGITSTQADKRLAYLDSKGIAARAIPSR